MSESTRIGPDGKPAVDVSINQKAVDRKVRESTERAQQIVEDAAPWSREKIIRELERVRSSEDFGEMNGRVLAPQLNLHGADLSGLDLSGINLSGSNMHGAKLTGSDLTGCSLSKANLHSADLSEAVLKGADLEGANLCEACICDADVSEASFKKANLSDACCEGAKGFGYTEKPLTAAEIQIVKYQQAEGFKAIADIDAGVAKYADETLEGANITGLTTSHVEFESTKDLGTLGK